ncbi:MAG: D-alanyl-D-alanine carboxypeptidase, partial [Mycobacterium sp.]|nr:D-alanyl-D-alanine carboxypeptidase [Mycobacterium sp.]
QGTQVGTLVEPDRSLMPTKHDAADQSGSSAQAGGVLPSADALPVRVGVGVIGAVIVFSLIMAARSMNRRPQHR